MRHVPLLLVALALAACGDSTGQAGSGSRPDAAGAGVPVVLGDPYALNAPRPLGPEPDEPILGDATPQAAPDPFTEPDPDATTSVARLGHAAFRDLAERLVSARYIDAYLSVDEAVLSTIGGTDPVAGAPPARLGCPEGGRLDVTRDDTVRGGRLDIVFAGCAIGETTLSGGLERSVAVDDFRLGSDEMLELGFRGLVVEAGEGERATIEGDTQRIVRRRANGDCGGEDTETALVHAITRAAVESDGADERVTGARYEVVVASARTTSSGDPADCTETTTMDFDGSATATGGRFGARSVSLVKRGRIERRAGAGVEPPAEATLEASADDGSRLGVTLVSDVAGTALTDVSDGAVAVSFATAYRFAP